jgi:hypothetical protein
MAAMDPCSVGDLSFTTQFDVASQEEPYEFGDD